MQIKNFSHHIFTILLVLAIITARFVLKIAQNVILLVFISVLLAFVFYPIVKKLNQSVHIPWTMSVIISVFIFVILFMLLFSILFISGSKVIENYPNYEAKFLSLYKNFEENFVDSKIETIMKALDANYKPDESFFKKIWDALKVGELLKTLTFSTSSSIISFFKNFFTVLLLMVFLLIEMKNGNEKIEMMFEGKRKTSVHNMVSKTIKEVVHYLSIKFFISFATSILVFILLMIMKIDFAIIWAFLAFVMNFIPTFGSIISVGITSLFALIQYFPNPIPMFVVLIGMTAINFTLGNIIEPKIEGDNLDLSPFIILVSLLFWGWMWGFVGMILSVPIMVILKIICENFKILHPIAILLGNKTSKTLKELSNFEDEEEEKNSKNAETNKS